jgi:soluble lytic murein transglycosylase-like protein
MALGSPKVINQGDIMLQTILLMLNMHLAPNAIPADILAKEIVHVSNAHNINPILVTKIILQESKGIENAYNPSSGDHGIMQLNNATIANMGLSHKCVYNWKCNIKAGTKLLATLNKHKDFRPCHYNTGRVGSKRNGGKNCLAYEYKLSQYIARRP